MNHYVCDCDIANKIGIIACRVDVHTKQRNTLKETIANAFAHCERTFNVKNCKRFQCEILQNDNGDNGSCVIMFCMH